MSVKVLLVDDSSSVRYLMKRILESDTAIRVCDSLADGTSALRVIQNEKPDVITLDLNMPGGLNGLEVTQRIMEEEPIPIIIVTSDEKSAANPFFLLEAGAVAVLRKPPAPGHPEHEKMAMQLIRTVKALAGVKLVRRIRSNPRTSDGELRKTAKPAAAPAASLNKMGCIAIGASVGGPQVIKDILTQLPADYPIPILITQHMAKGFVQNFVNWLTDGCKIKIVVAAQGQPLQAGHAYIAPDDQHLGISSSGHIALSGNHAEYLMRPSVSYMLRSVEQAFGKDCVAIMLTGMGRDGANEMASLRIRGALTIAQDSHSALVNGMPGAAIDCGGVSEVLAPGEIVSRMLGIAAERAKPRPD